MNKFNFNIPQKSLWYLLVCGGIILSLVLAGIFPLYRYNAIQAKEIKNLESQLRAQGELGPIYLKLTATMKNKKEFTLPYPVKRAVLREEAGKFPDVFKAIAEKSGLRMVSITPDLRMLTEKPPYLLQHAVVRGEFADFRNLLIELGKVPYLEKIEEISIRQLPDTMELKAEIWLAVTGL